MFLKLLKNMVKNRRWEFAKYVENTSQVWKPPKVAVSISTSDDEVTT